MKNSFLLFLLYFFSILIACFFSNQSFLGRIVLYFPFLILAYIFYSSTLWISLGMAAMSIAVLGAYTHEKEALTIFVLLLYAMIEFFKRKVLRPNLIQKTSWVFLLLGLFFLYLRKDYLWSQQAYLFWGRFVVELFLIYAFCIFLWYLLEEKGAAFEEKYLNSKNSERQMNLFTVQQLRQSRKNGPFKFQRRVRKRFGLKDSW